VPEQLKIGLIITLILIGFLLYKKKKPKPTQLDLTGFINDRVSDEKKLTGVRKVEAQVVEDVEPGAPIDKHVFSLDGKKYNAWAVLDVPLGGSVSEIKKAYAFRTQTDAANQNLYFKAYDVLIRR